MHYCSVLDFSRAIFFIDMTTHDKYLNMQRGLLRSISKRLLLSLAPHFDEFKSHLRPHFSWGSHAASLCKVEYSTQVDPGFPPPLKLQKSLNDWLMMQRFKPQKKVHAMWTESICSVFCLNQCVYFSSDHDLVTIVKLTFTTSLSRIMIWVKIKIQVPYGTLFDTTIVSSHGTTNWRIGSQDHIAKKKRLNWYQRNETI